MKDDNRSKSSENNRKLKKAIEEIASAIKRIDFGEIRITMHNGMVVQIEKCEKKRF